MYQAPVGYDAVINGLLGACLLLTGIVAAIITAPLFDRVLTHHLAITAKVLTPPLVGAWISLIWAGQRFCNRVSKVVLMNWSIAKPNNTGGLFVIITILGITSVTLLPIGLELGAELTRNADGSSAILWFMWLSCVAFTDDFYSRYPIQGQPAWNYIPSRSVLAQIFSVLQLTSIISVEQALRASRYASPPRNMRKALIFNGVFVGCTSVTVFFLRGRQERKRLDEEMLRELERNSRSQEAI